MAEDATRALLYAISHDLQAPLRHIHGYVSLLERSDAKLEDTDRRHLEALRDNADRMQRMLDAALVLSRLETEPMEPTTVDLGAVVADAQNELEDHHRASEVAWTVGDLPTVHGDAGRLGRLVLELLRNVLDHGATAAQVHAEREGDTTRLVIEDEGPGFPDRFAERATHLFQTMGRSGTGAGLAIAARIAQQHGGSLEVDTEEGRGVRVRVVLKDA